MEERRRDSEFRSVSNNTHDLNLCIKFPQQKNNVHIKLCVVENATALGE